MSNLQSIISQQLGKQIYIGRKFNDNNSDQDIQRQITKKIYNRLQKKIQQKNLEYLSNYTNVDSSKSFSPLKKENEGFLDQKNDQNRKSKFLQSQEEYNDMYKLIQSRSRASIQTEKIDLKQNKESQLIASHPRSTLQQSVEILNRYESSLNEKAKKKQITSHNTQTGTSFFSTKPNTARTNIHTRAQSHVASHKVIYPETNQNNSHCSSSQWNQGKEHNSVLSSARSIVPISSIIKKDEIISTNQGSLDNKRERKSIIILQKSLQNSQEGLFKDELIEDEINIAPFLNEKRINDNRLSRVSSAQSIKIVMPQTKEQNKLTPQQKREAYLGKRPQTAFSMNQIQKSQEFQKLNDGKQRTSIKREESCQNLKNNTKYLENEQSHNYTSRTNLKSALPSRRSQMNTAINHQTFNSQSFISQNNEISQQENQKKKLETSQSSLPKPISLNSKLNLEEKQEMYREKRKKQSDILPFFDYKGDESVRFLHLYLFLKKNDILNMIYNFADNITTLEFTVWEIITKAVETRQLKVLAKILIFIGQIEVAVGNLDKSAYFLNQARICCDLMRDSDFIKSQAYMLLGDISIYSTKYSESVLFYKKALQYAWFCNSKEQEIDMYDKLGIAYYYLQDLQKSSFYHQRAMVADYENMHSHLRKISNEVTNDIRKNQIEDQPIINYMVFAHLSLPLNLAEMDFFQYTQNENQALHTSVNSIGGAGTGRESKLLFTAINRKSFVNQSNAGIVNNDVTQITNTSAIVDSVNQKLQQHHYPASSRPSTSIKQNKVPQPSSNIQLKSTEEDYKPNTFRQPEEQEEWSQHESTARVKRHLYEKAQLDIIIDNILKEEDFIFQMSTPKHSITSENPQQIEKTKYQIHREKFENSNLKRVNYDFKSFGVISKSQSQRKFDDLTLYKFPLEKKIEILKSQNFDLDHVWHRINRTIASSKRYNQQVNDRIRLNQNTPNRCAANYKNFPKITYNKIKSIYEKLLNEFEIRNDNANQ